ncbi:hypothetical protein PAMP_022729 [Pampus punctatissimus]
MIGRKNSGFPLSSQGHVKSVLLESRKVLTLSVGSRCHETWEIYFGSIDKAAEGLPMFPKNIVKETEIVDTTNAVTHLCVKTILTRKPVYCIYYKIMDMMQ